MQKELTKEEMEKINGEGGVRIIYTSGNGNIVISYLKSIQKFVYVNFYTGQIKLIVEQHA